MNKEQIIKTGNRIGLKLPKSWTKAAQLRVLNATLERQISLVEDAIEHHEKFRNAYFWSPPGSASGRRSMEKKNYMYHSVTLDGDKYMFEANVSCSCKNVYYSGNFYKNDNRKNLKTYKKLLETLNNIKDEAK